MDTELMGMPGMEAAPEEMAPDPLEEIRARLDAIEAKIGMGMPEVPPGNPMGMGMGGGMPEGPFKRRTPPPPPAR